MADMAVIADSELIQALDTAQAAAREAGAYLRSRQGHELVQGKKALHDDLLDVDLEAEDIILAHLRAAFPHYAVLSEEAGNEDVASVAKWIVDPLDGSANYQHGSPVFGVAIGLMVTGVTMLSAIYLPVADEMYTALRGHGAKRDGSPIHVSNTGRLDDAIVYVGDFAKTGDHDENAPRVATITRLADSAYRVRMIGTAATDFAYLASGRADALVMYNSHPWDLRAGALLVEEAGGKAATRSTSDGTIFNLFSNGHIQKALEELAIAAPMR